jgi:hypothetical protein
MINMLMNILRSFKCKRSGHELLDAGSCPFTGLTYKECVKCGSLMSVDNRAK